MELIDGIVERVALVWARRKAEKMFGKNWKGKAGGVGMMLTGAAGLFSGGSCIINALTGDGGVSLSACWTQIGPSIAMIAAGLAAFGIRDALGKQE